MATNTEEILSGSTNGRAILVSQTATPGNLIHTAIAGTASEDNLWLYAASKHTAAVEITVEYGGVTTADQIIVSIPPKEGLILVIPGLPLNGGVVVRVFAAIANVISVVGMVHRRLD